MFGVTQTSPFNQELQQQQQHNLDQARRIVNALGCPEPFEISQKDYDKLTKRDAILLLTEESETE